LFVKKGENKMGNMCYANKNGNCKVIKGGECDCESCDFHKSKEEFEEDHMKSVEKINSLNPLLRMFIIDKYYGGEADMSISKIMNS
jgi:hypothetical protein